jgi:hypothetical protein
MNLSPLIAPRRGAQIYCFTGGLMQPGKILDIFQKLSTWCSIG